MVLCMGLEVACVHHNARRTHESTHSSGYEQKSLYPWWEFGTSCTVLKWDFKFSTSCLGEASQGAGLNNSPGNQKDFPYIISEVVVLRYSLNMTRKPSSNVGSAVDHWSVS